MKPKKKKPIEGVTKRRAADMKSNKRRLSSTAASARPARRVKTYAHQDDADATRHKTTARRVTRATATRAREVFPFMELAGEIRNRIYEMVIEDMATTPDLPMDVFDCRLDPLNWGPSWIVSGVSGAQSWRIPAWKHEEQKNLRESRKNLASCRLGEVSRAIRNEFVPLLWSYIELRYCPCGLDIVEEETALSRLDHPLIRGKLKHIVYDLHFHTHGGAGDYPGKFKISKLANFLFALEFKGSIKIIGEVGIVHLVKEALKVIGATYNNSAAAQKAKRQFRRIEVQIDKIHSWKLEETIEFDFQRTKWCR
ncbi:uncharacterized protein LTHEOB_3962 [Neofusicoccum parvum]|uniref:Uncharacterized protein LTHEOB_3962 n=1 Tax=Neofusicoccum parvum TaxID=310453 RepID=A0ACB5RT59_9PEZI|nr:uncharacterized protein LTHEOB_3962 [Neofusicoccum parvum]